MEGVMGTEAVEELANAIDRAEDGAGWFLNVGEGLLAEAILAALRADPAAARAVRDALDPDGLREALVGLRNTTHHAGYCAADEDPDTGGCICGLTSAIVRADMALGDRAEK